MKEVLCFLVFCINSAGIVARIKSRNDYKYLIKTPGCSIPNYMKSQYLGSISDPEPSSYADNPCGKRMVRIDREADSIIRFTISGNIARQLDCEDPACTYRVYTYRKIKGYRSKPTIFSDGDVANITKDSWVMVKCYKERNQLCYTDWFTVLNRKNKTQKKLRLKQSHSGEEPAWNILILGIDTTSRGRLVYSMPKTFEYLKSEGWMDYIGYHKVDYNTMPNLLAILTGKTHKWIKENCSPLSRCTNEFLFRKFSNSGYFTAYGDDTLLPSLKHENFVKNRFRVPVDHFFRVIDQERIRHYICFGQEPTSVHLLDHALQFITTYKYNKFFGLFWMVNQSHALRNRIYPTIAPLQDSLHRFFEEMKDEGILDNTFVFFLSDHGINHGSVVFTSTEMYYDSRLPFLFLWVPSAFRNMYPEKFVNIKNNQYRLTSHYDTYATLVQILQMHDTNVNISAARGCQTSTGFFHQLSKRRKCARACVEDVWCACHDMLSTEGSEHYEIGYKSMLVALADLNERLLQENQNRSYHYQCAPLYLTEVLRIHYYYGDKKTYYVSAGFVQPAETAFEATVTVPRWKTNNYTYEIINMHHISYYKNDCSKFGDPTLQFCYCS